MLSKFIVSSYATLLEVSMWMILVGSFLGGVAADGILTGIIAVIMAFIFCVVFFGAFFVLVDIQKGVRSIQENIKKTP